MKTSIHKDIANALRKSIFTFLLTIITLINVSAQISMSSATTGVLSNASTVTISYTNASGSNQVLMVGISAQQPGSSVTSITYNGVSLTKLGNLSNSSQSRIEIWYLQSPAIGTYNLVVNNSGGDNAVIGAMTFSGVHQTSPFGTLVTAQGSSTIASVTAASATNDIVYSVAAFNNGSTLTHGTDQTERWDQTVNSSITGGGSTKAGATSITMTATSTSSASWTIGAVALKPASVSVTYNPGGVTGSVLWLKANAGVTTGSTLTWADQSGYNRNGVQATAANQPTINSSAINFNPVLTFDGTNDFLSVQNLTGLPIGASMVQEFAVGTQLSSTGVNGRFFSYGPSIDAGIGKFFFLGKNTANNAMASMYGTDAVSTLGEFSNPVPVLEEGKYTGTQLILSSFGVQRSAVTATSIRTADTGTIGSDPTGTANLWKGYIPEVIVFPTNLTATQTLQVNSYLALKYGITLDQTTALNYVNSAGTVLWNGTTNSAYKNNIAGIARDDASALNQKQSKSVNAGLQVVIGNGNTIATDNVSNTNNFSVDKSALVWGDNAGSVAAWTNTSAPTGYRIVSRSWKVQETGTVGSVKVQVAASSGTNGLPDNDTRGVLLLVDADGNFATGVTAIPMILNGTNWEANVDFSTGQFFTFANAVAPELSLTLTQVTCFGGNNGAINVSASGGATPYSYSWTASNGGVVPTGQASNQNLTGLIAGTYTLVVTSANFEQVTTSVNITQSDAIILNTVITPAFPTGSNNGAIDLSVSNGMPPYTYAWSPGGATTQDISSLATGTYNVTVTDANGCTASTTAVVGSAINPRKQLYLTDPSQALDRIDPVATADATTAQSAVLSTPISIVGAAASSNSGQTVSTHTFAYNSGTTGVNRALFVGVSYRNSGTNGRDISSVTYGGQTMTLVGSQENTTYLLLIPTRHAKVYIYRLLSPPTGSNNLVVNWNGALEYGAVVGAVTYENVNQTTPTGTFAGNTGNTSTPSVSVAGAANRLMFGVVAGRSTTNYASTTSGGTQLWSSRPFSGNTAGSGQIAEGAASVNLTWSGSSDYWATGGVSVIPASVSANTTFTQTPVLCDNLTIKAGEPISVSTYITVSTGTMPVNPDITATLRYGATNIVSLPKATYNSATGLLRWSGVLSSDVTIPAGQSIALDVTTLQTGVSFKIDYDSQTKPSKIELPVSTVININSYAVYNAPYPGGSVITTAPSGATIYLRAVVSDPFGSDDITGLTINVSPGGAVLNSTSVATTGCTRTYEYVASTTGLGSGVYSIPATAKEGYENMVTHSFPLTFNLCDPIGIPVFALGATSTRCQGGGTETYTATSTNSTDIIYTLDEASLLAGNTISASTGLVTYASGWSGTSIITATASGCDEPKTAIHTVTITPTVGTPVFTLGTTTQRCRGIETVSYTATATNSTGITYTLDAVSTTAGNSINTSTGAVTYIAGWSGTSTITATATGCNGPKVSTHTATTVAIDAVDDAASGDQGNPIPVNVLANDLCDINPSSLTIVSQPQSGNLQIGTNGQITYLPNGSFYGSDQFTYRICSNGTPAVCDEAAVNITVNQVFNDPCAEATQAKTFYMPFPENTKLLRRALLGAASANYLDNTTADNVRTITSIKCSYPNTIITYDHWEDSYEVDITYPTQSTTLVWGDGNLSNGIAPGYPNDIIPAGGYIVIDNQFAYNPRVATTIVFDGKDKIYSTADIAVSTVKGDAGYGGGSPLFSVQNVKTNVVDITRFGKYFVIPFGENVTNSQDNSLTTGVFKYTGLFVRAATNGTVVGIDTNGDGTVEATSPTLNEGDVWLYDGTTSAETFGILHGQTSDVNQSNDIKAGATVTSNYPVGVDVIFGGIDTYGTRNMALLPGKFYGSTYYTPVHNTLATAPSYVFFTNTMSSPVTINWTAGTGTTGTINVPAKGNNFMSLTENAGYKFQSAGEESYTAVSIQDAADDADGSSTYDWAFNLIPESRLTTFASVAWAPGSNNGTANYNPVWVTPVAATTLYVKYDGNMTTKTATMSPCNLPYDIAIPLTALQSYKIYNPSTSNDQSGMSVYTCDGTKIAAVWGQDPNAGNPTPIGSPAMDVGYVMEPRCLQANVFATDDLITTQPNTSIIVGVLANDIGFLCNLNSTSVNSTGLLQPANGTIVINANGTITYTPNPGYEGTDQFEYRVYSSDYPGISDVALVTVKVTDCAANATENLITGKVFVEQLPDDGVYDSSEMGAAGVQVNLYTDANCNGTIDTGDNIGQSTISDLSGNYVFHTQNGYNAKDNFATASFSGNDGGINWTTSWVEQGELSQNVSAGDVRIMADASTSASSNAIRIAGATNGISRSLTFNNATSASLRFSYRKEGINGIPPNAKTLTVTVNGTPVYTIQDGDYAGGTDPNYTEVTIPLTAFNPNSSNTVQFMSSSTLGTTEYFWIDNVELTYFKNPACYIIKVDPSNTNGAYTTSSLNSQTAQFTNIGVCEKVNNLGVLANLVASDDAANTATDIPVVINVLANDVNGKPNPATVTTTGLANQPANGTVQVNEDGTITYTPNPGFSGSDDFEYRVCSLEDPSVCDIALVTVTVSCISIANQNTITGNVYNDVNLNGALNAGETGASGVMVNLFRDTDNDGVLDTGEPLVDTKTTSTLGAYLFEITPPVTTNTYLDQFTSTSTTSSVLATQTYGTTSWTTSWTEIGVTNGFLTAPTRITSTSGLSIEGNGSTTVLGALRTANISTGIAATLSFNVAESGLDMDVNDYVDVQVSTTASGPWTLLKRYTGADGNQTGTGSFDITPYISATTTIRFVTSGVSTMVAGDIVNFDNIQISYNVPTAAKYIVQLAQPLPRGYSLTTPLPSPTGIQTASFTGSGAGDCQNNFGLTSIVAENDINQTPLNTPTSGQLLTNDEGVTSITGATIGGNAFILGTAKQVSGVDDNGNSVANAGSLTINSNGTYTFTPASGFTGTINPVTYTGTGLNGATETAILSIEVLSKLTPGNNPPVAQNDVNSTTVGITINSTVLSNDSDPNGDTITVTSASITLGSAITVAGMDIYGNAVTNAGTVTLNANGTYTYIPASGFIGTVNDITYIISDGKGGTDSAILSINVLQNDGNTIFANDDANTGIRGTTLNGNVLTNDSDPEGNTMNVTAAIANGTTINIGTATAIPNVGTLTLNNNGSYTFVPDAGYTGNVSIPYTICDNGTPTAACDQATLYLTELPTGPVADNDINQVPAGTTATGNVLTNDEYNGTATVTSAQYYNASGILTPLPVGTATPVYTSTGTFAGTMRLNSDGGYSFVPDAGFTGTVPVNYTMSDTYGSDATILTIEVIAAGSLSQNDKPIAQDDVSGTEINTQVSGNALSNDSDVDGNTLTIASATQGGTSVTMGSPTVVAGVDVAGNAVANAGSITLNANGTYTFTPTTGFTGTVNPISYTLSDGNGGNDTANIYITVYPNTGNNVFANDDANTGIVGTTLNGNVLTNDFDPESNTMTVTAATANATTINIGTATYIPNVGTLTLNGNGSYTFVPDADYTGTASIPYTICDNGTPQACDQATLYLTELPTTVKLWVGTTSTVFNTGSNWSAGVVPNQGDDIVFATAANNGGVPALNDLVIPVNDPKTIGSLTNLSEKSLIVPAGASLTVAGVVTGSETNPARIQVLAAENTPNGTLILAGQPCESTVMGTVQLYAKGKKDVETSWVDNVPGSPTFGTTLYGTYQWQHFGVPVEEVIANPTFYKSYLKKYHEDWNQKVTGTTPATTYYAKWENLVNSSMLKAFEGYEITQNVPTTYIIAGKLNYCDKTITLTRKAPLVTGSTDTNINNRYYGLGQNIFGNSYTASIDIDNLVFPPKVEPTVYLYNTGRFTDWATTEGGLNETGLSAGQYTSIPQNTAPAIFDGRIPSMNGFLLIHRGPQPYYESETDDDVTMSLPYINGLVANTRPQTVARKPLSFLKISLASKSTRDNLWLFSQEGTTDKLDDGWDGRKFFGTPTAFIYTENADGPLQVSADATIDGKVLSFYANSDTEYTLQLAKTNLEDYPNLQLIDLRSRTITPLTGDVTTYRFTADSKGLVEKRFIIANSSFIDFNSDKFKFLDGYLSNNNRLIITNFTPKSGTMHLYDISGKTLINRNITPSVNEIPVSLLSGVYILHLQADDKRETIKLIIK